MPLKMRTTGCLVSIVASVVLTVALNLLLRGCSARGDASVASPDACGWRSQAPPIECPGALAPLRRIPT